MLYAGADGIVAHECIIDCRGFAGEAGIEVEDVAKRLMDYGFHAPTMSWPVAGTLMIEPTESESQRRTGPVLRRDDRDPRGDPCIAAGRLDRADNPLKNAPHTARGSDGRRLAPRLHARAGGISAAVRAAAKYWPPVKRVDNVYGDRNLVCTCAPLTDYAEAAD